MASDKNSIILNAQRLTAKGEIDKAIEAWKTLIAETPNDGNIYNTVGDLYLKKNAKAQAIEAFLKAGTTFQDAGFALKTIAVYKKIIKLDPTRMDVVLKLADVNAERGIVGNAVEDYLKVARHQLKEGRVKSAIEVYRKIAALDQSNPTIGLKLAELCHKEGMLDEAREELTRVATFLESAGRTDELAQVRARLAELGLERVSAAAPPEPTFEVERASLAEGSAEETTMMTDAEPPRAAGAPPADIAAPDPVQAPPAPELSRLKTAQEFDETTHERLRDALTEADVYVKYGMVDKAIAHVKALAQHDPNDVAIQLKLKELYIVHGDTRAAAEVCQRVAELYRTLGQDAESEAILREAAELSPDSSVVPSGDEQPEAAGQSEEPAGVAGPASSDPAANDALEQDLAEADFYFQQGFDEEARRLFSAILKKEPGHALAVQRLGELDSRAASAQPASAAGHAPSEHELEGTSRTVRPSELEETSLGASLTLQEPPVIAGAQPPKSANPPGETTKEEEYIDLVEALREDMERSLPPEEPEELSQELSAERELENVFRKFQKGVQEQYGKEDYETHYNLGVAYREMGLLNEAISEFRLVLKSPDRLIAATSMIASCYRSKGALPRAEETLLEILNKPEYAEMEGIAGLAFELGQILEVQGRNDDALAQYYRAKELEPGHQEAVNRIAQLERRSAGPPQAAPAPKPTTGGKRAPEAPQPARQDARRDRKKVSYL
ncbi:MAG: tetratricopeptide repeat protein [Nitrospirota bacterium]